MTSFVAIYRGQSVAAARLIAVSADPDLVADVSGRLLEKRPVEIQDAVVENLERGRRAALQLIQKEATSGQE